MINYFVWLPAPNEAMRDPRIEKIVVKPSDFARRVDARWLGSERTRWVKAGEGAAGIANEATLLEARIGVRPGDLARGVDARWRRDRRSRYKARTRWVKAGDGAAGIANEAMHNAS